MSEVVSASVLFAPACIIVIPVLAALIRCCIYRTRALIRAKADGIRMANLKKERGVGQSMYLIEAKRKGGDTDGWVFRVEGATGQLYRVELVSRMCSCTCADFKHHQTVCKHIYFIVGRVARCTLVMRAMTSDPFDFKMTKELDNAITASTAGERTPAPVTGSEEEEDECSICFESVDGVGQVECDHCHNGFHMECMARWWANKKTTCPLCRGSFYKRKRSTTATATDCFKKFRKYEIDSAATIVDLTGSDGEGASGVSGIAALARREYGV